ncbi:MAG: carboxypeptidase-like regulatory domain-containing protein [Thermoplasmata archaeon]|nr:carboxypeptidase-like regulatory domain-containing protein [Thermoplasmata archaeon]
MKGKTTCPKCKTSFVLEIPDTTKDVHEATCPKCGHKFKLKMVKKDEDHSWEEIGEPRKAILSSIKEKTNKPMIAGILLVIVFISAIITSSSVLITIEPMKTNEKFLNNIFASIGEVTITGTVLDNITKQPIKNVTISVVDTNISTFSKNGSFELKNVPLGYRTLNISAEDYKTLHVKIFLLKNLFSKEKIKQDFYLDKGSGVEEKEERGLLNLLIKSWYICSILIIIFGLLALVGAIACFMRKYIIIALIGSIFGIFTFGIIFIGPLCSIIALIIILLSREEFKNEIAKEF